MDERQKRGFVIPVFYFVAVLTKDRRTGIPAKKWSRTYSDGLVAARARILPSEVDDITTCSL